MVEILLAMQVWREGSVSTESFWMGLAHLVPFKGHTNAAALVVIFIAFVGIIIGT